MDRTERKIIFIVYFVMILIMGIFFLPRPVVAGGTMEAQDERIGEATKVRVQETYGKLPFYFIQNDGQVDEKVKFYEKGSGHATFFTKEGVYISLSGHKEVAGSDVQRQEARGKRQDNSPSVIARDEIPKQSHNSESSTPAIPSPLTGESQGGGDKEGITSQFIKLSFLNANKDPEIIAVDQQASKVNYFLGNDPRKWRTNIPTYQSVLYKEVYPGIDIKFYGNNRQLEYDIIVKPGADPSKVKFAYEGIEGLKVAENGDLEIILHPPSPLRGESSGEGNRIVQKKPIIYQEIDGKMVAIDGKFVIDGKGEGGFAYTFELASYDKNHSLIIDPVLVYSTYLGGSVYDSVYDITVGGSGSVYVTGSTESTGFPTTTGAYDTSYNGGRDVFVARLNSKGSALVYATFIGGSGEDKGWGIAVDGSEYAYVTGETQSAGFPTTTGAYDTDYNGLGDVFVVTLNSRGSGLIYGTFIGGNDSDYGWGIAVDGSRNAYVTGYTYSTSFPTTTGAYDTSHNGGSDVFVAKLNSTGSTLTYGTFMGGSSYEYGRDIAVDGSGYAYVTGDSASSNFPTTTGAYDTSYNGNADGFVAKLNSSGSTLTYGTFIGGSSTDRGYGIAVDGSGYAYVTGETASSNFPTTTGAYDTSFNGVTPYNDVFVAKLNSTGSALTYATFIGGSSGESGYGIAVDGLGYAYVTGYTDSTGFPTTPGAYDTSHNGGSDVFVAKLNSTGSALTYGTFIGGSNNDVAGAIAVDGGYAYIAGSTYYSGFPTTTGAYDTSYNGDFDGFIVKFSFGIPVSSALSGDQRYPWIDYNDTTGEYLVLWQDKRNGSNDDIYGVLLDQKGNRIGSDFPVSTASGHQQRVLVKSGGGGYLAVWHDLRNAGTNGADIYGAWIDGDGTVGPEMVICACAQHQWNPVAGYDLVSNTFLVVFLSGTGSGTGNDIYDLWGAVIPAGGTGSVTPFTMVTVIGAQRGPQIGYDDGNYQYYMAWNDRRGSNYDIYGSRVTTSGTLLDGGGTGILLSGATGNQFRPTVTDRSPAVSVNNHLIAWTDYRPGAQADVYGIYVEGNGAAVGSEFVISTNTSDQANVVADVDWINRKEVVGWIDKRNGTDYDIYNATVDQTGGVFGETVIVGQSTGESDEQRGEVVTYAYDGATDYGFLAVWMDRRNGTDYDIWGMKVWSY